MTNGIEKEIDRLEKPIAPQQEELEILKQERASREEMEAAEFWLYPKSQIARGESAEPFLVVYRLDATDNFVLAKEVSLRDLIVTSFDEWTSGAYDEDVYAFCDELRKLADIADELMRRHKEATQ